MTIINILKKKFVKFIIVGAFSTAIDFIIYFYLSKIIDIVIAKTVSMICSSIFSYFLNKLWTFNIKDKKNFKYILKYYITFAINVLTNVSMNYIVFTNTNNKIIAFVFATGVAMMVNYLLQKFFVFKKGSFNNYE